MLGPTNARLIEGQLDTATDDTVFPDGLAALLGIDLTNAPEGEATGIGGQPVARLRFAPVRLRLATASEQREWPAFVAFTAARLRYPLLGFAGVLQFFHSDFRGDDEQVELTINSRYPGN